MRTRTPLATYAIALGLMLLLPAVTANPLAIVPTTIQPQVDVLGEGSTLDPGALSEGFARTEFCYEFGGTNPLGGSFVFEYAVMGSPEWLDVRMVGGNSQPFTPPTGPQPYPGCTILPIMPLLVSVAPEAPPGAVGTVTVTVTTNDEGNTGTYQNPGDATAVALIHITPA